MNAIVPRLARVLGLLGSDFDGEVLNAARLAERLRRQSGLAWSDLLLSANPAERSIPDPPHWRDLVEACQRRAGLLTEWERGFIASIARRPSLSPKQLAVLERIHTKV